MLLAAVAVVSCYQRAVQVPASFHKFWKSSLSRLAGPVNTAVASFTPAPAPGIDLFVAGGYRDCMRCARAPAFLDAAVVLAHVVAGSFRSVLAKCELQVGLVH